MPALEASMPRGACPIEAFGALQEASAPIVLLFMDAFGPRPALFSIAECLAGEGYRTLVPHLFYDQLPYRPLDLKAVFSGSLEEKERMMALLRPLDQARIDLDVAALLDFVEHRFGPVAVGATGYCLGGGYALTAAVTSPRMAFAASFHGSNLAPDRDDGPHRRLAGVKSRLYVGIAGVDPTFGGAEEGRLAAALRDGGVDHVIETYAGCYHGFVPQDTSVHDPLAAERHWFRLSQTYARPFLRALFKLINLNFVPHTIA